MIVKSIAAETTKLCHARPGDVVQFIASDLAEESQCYLVITVHEDPAMFKSLGSSGLYEIDPRVGNILLASLTTGILLRVPNLSSRCHIFRKAEVHVGKLLEMAKS